MQLPRSYPSEYHTIFGNELEVLLSQHLENDNEKTEDNKKWEEDEKLEE